MNTPDLPSGLPDPADRAAPWHDGAPAYLAWHTALCGADPTTIYRVIRERRLISQYAEAVPSPDALDALGQLGPLLEIGAGTGYWARLLQDCGVDVLPVDLPAGRGWDLGSPWTAVTTADHRAVTAHPERVPFVCWPPRPNGFVPDLLQLTTAPTLALITNGPMTTPSGSADPLYSALEVGGWRAHRRVDLPTWPARFDHLTIWRR